MQKPTLKRTMGLMMLTFYGLGTIVGAGIYVLIGTVAGFAGEYLPISFLVAGVIAGLTAMSYAELAIRFPVCAGVAVYVEEAWKNKGIAAFAGWMIVLTGIVSCATIANGFSGYLNVFFEVPGNVAMIVLLLLLFIIAASGIDFSAKTVFVITLVEVCGLLYVTFLAIGADGNEQISQFSASSGSVSTHYTGIIVGSFLAFYAFIGFEDMVNVIEEVKNPGKNFPRAIILSVLIAVILYISVSVAAVSLLPVEMLAESTAPLSDIVSVASGSQEFIALISVLAVINGALVQIIMGSRVLYGMSSRKMAFHFFSSLHGKTHTPLIATAFVTVLVIFFAWLLPIVQLASITSFIILLLFAMVNGSLIKIKSRDGEIEGAFRIPSIIPWLGMFTCIALAVFQVFRYL